MVRGKFDNQPEYTTGMAGRPTPIKIFVFNSVFFSICVVVRVIPIGRLVVVT